MKGLYNSIGVRYIVKKLKDNKVDIVCLLYCSFMENIVAAVNSHESLIKPYSSVNAKKTLI